MSGQTLRDRIVAVMGVLSLNMVLHQALDPDQHNVRRERARVAAAPAVQGMRCCPLTATDNASTSTDGGITPSFWYTVAASAAAGAGTGAGARPTIDMRARPMAATALEPVANLCVVMNTVSAFTSSADGCRSKSIRYALVGFPRSKATPADAHDTAQRTLIPAGRTMISCDFDHNTRCSYGRT